MDENVWDGILRGIGLGKGSSGAEAWNGKNVRAIFFRRLSKKIKLLINSIHAKKKEKRNKMYYVSRAKTNPHFVKPQFVLFNRRLAYPYFILKNKSSYFF